MKPGTIGTVIVLVGGGVLGAAVFAKDRAQLLSAKKQFTEGQTLLSQGDARKAQEKFRGALQAALVVGGITGRRPAALEVAADARRGLRLCDAIASVEKDNPARFDLVDEALARTGEGALPSEGHDRLEKLEKTKLARELGLEAEALEKIAAMAERRDGEAGTTKAELDAIASKAWKLAEDAASAPGQEADARFSRGKRRCHARALVQGALAANAADEGAKAHKLADEATAALRDATDAFDAAEDQPWGSEKERKALETLVHGIVSEGADREKVNAFEQAVTALEKQIGTKDLGALFPKTKDVPEPEIEGKSGAAADLAKKIAASKARLEAVRAVAADFEGMVLAIDENDHKVYVDRTEVTNAEFKKFVDAVKPYTDGRTKEVWGSDDAAKLAEDFIDATGAPGPKTWRSGTFPQGKEDHPVAGVSELEARAFCLWKKKRLPTYEEWRGAAGSASAYPWGDDWRDGGGNVRLGDAKSAGTTPVGQFTAAPSGAVDLVGNVCELVEGPRGIFFAVGGSYDSRPDAAKLTTQLPPIANYLRPSDQGFRCAKELSWKK